MTSALKAGWICFGIGLALSWFFPLANVFFSIAIIGAIVAMCTHQVSRGLILLLSTLCALALCAFIFFVLVIGTIGIAVAPGLKKADENLKKMQNAQTRSLNQANTALQQLQASTATWPNPSVARPRSGVGASDAAQRAASQTRAAAAEAERGRARTREAVTQAEIQRDRINAKQQRIDQLQKAIDSVDHTIQDIRSRGGDASFWTKRREQLLSQKWELQR